MRKEKVMPKGSPARVKPIKIGMLEQEQKGVTVPKRAAIMAPLTPVKPVKILLGREIGLDVANEENQRNQQNGNLDSIIQEKM